jgi:hypothetical protein
MSNVNQVNCMFNAKRPEKFPLAIKLLRDSAIILYRQKDKQTERQIEREREKERGRKKLFFTKLLFFV